MITITRRLCDVDSYPASLPAVAAHGLPGSTLSFPPDFLGGESWAGLLAGVRKHRLIGHLRAAIDAGTFPATAEQADDVRAQHRGILLRVLALERELTRVVDLLSEFEVDSRVLKGSAVAHLDYPQPALRSFIDLDILVREDDIERTVAVLSSADFARTLAEPRPGFDRRFDKGLTLRHPTGFELDLHRTFVLGPWGRLLDLTSLWEDSAEFTVGAHRLRALSRTDRFLHACYHAALGDWPLRLGSLRDVAQLLPRDEREADDVVCRAGSWGVGAVISAAVADTYRLLGVETSVPIRTWAEDYPLTRREESWLALHTHGGKTFAAQALATVPTLPTLRDKAAYLQALLLPDPRYTADRHASKLARFSYALREIRRGHRS